MAAFGLRMAAAALAAAAREIQDQDGAEPQSWYSAGSDAWSSPGESRWKQWWRHEGSEANLPLRVGHVESPAGSEGPSRGPGLGSRQTGPTEKDYEEAGGFLRMMDQEWARTRRRIGVPTIGPGCDGQLPGEGPVSGTQRPARRLHPVQEGSGGGPRQGSNGGGGSRARAGGHAGPGRSPRPVEADKLAFLRAVSRFVHDNRLDGKAAQGLRAADPEVARVVMGQGGLDSARCPSAALMVRLRVARERGVGGNGPPQDRRM